MFGRVDQPPEDFAAFHRGLFEQYEEFAQTLLKTRLVIPALDYCLKCSHIFNVLDASSGIGVAERTAYILRVRKLAVAIARAYVDDGQVDEADG